jgi:hypothetical protein
MIDLREHPQVYTASPGLTSNPWLFFGGGIGLVLVALFGFFVSLKIRTGPLQLHLRTTLPMILATGLFATGYTLARSPRAVALSPQGLHVRFRSAEKLLPWDQIAWAEVGSQAITGRKLLSIYATSGKVLLKLPANLDHFDSLVAAVKGRLTEHPSPHADALRWRKLRKTSVALLVGSAFMLAGSAYVSWETYDDHRSETLMRTQGVDGEALVVRKFLAPDGRTRRIEYRVAGAGENAPLHNVEVDQMVWMLAQDGERLPVKTVPGHPEIARLAAGEIKDSFKGSPALNIGLSIALFIAGIVFTVGAVLGFKGIEIATDSDTHRLKITRLTRPGTQMR